MDSQDQNSLYLLLGEMSADIKNILKKGLEQDARLEHHSSRIQNLEKFQWKVLGGATVISVAIGYLVKLM